MVSSSHSSSSRSPSSYRHPRPACEHAAINQQARRLGGAERGATADNRDVPGTSGLPCQVTVQWAGSTPRSTLDVECQSSSRNVTSRRQGATALTASCPSVPTSAKRREVPVTFVFFLHRCQQVPVAAGNSVSSGAGGHSGDVIGRLPVSTSGIRWR